VKEGSGATKGVKDDRGKIDILRAVAGVIRFFVVLRIGAFKAALYDCMEMYLCDVSWEREVIVP